MNRIIACIDGSSAASAVCDCAIWTSRRLGAPLTLLHVLDRGRYPEPGDLSGAIGLGSREQLLDELSKLDEQRGKLALEQGQLMLEAAGARVLAAGLEAPELSQRYGDLVEVLQELAPQIRLLVIGRRGVKSRQQGLHVGSHLESVTRTLQRPMLIVPETFKEPGSLLLAYDASPNAQLAVRMLAASPLFKGLPLHLLMVGKDSEEHREALADAEELLENADFLVTTEIRKGEVEQTLLDYQLEHGLDLLVMGAHGHSRIRQFFLGSTTHHMLRISTTPLLLLR